MPDRRWAVQLWTHAAAAVLYATLASAQPAQPGAFEIQLGALASTSEVAARAYRVRLGNAPTVAFAWNSGLDRWQVRVPLEVTLHLSGSATPTAACVGYCKQSDFTALTASFGADVVMSPHRSGTAAPYFAVGARARAYGASASCPAMIGAYCPGNDPLTASGIRPALAFAIGTRLRVGARQLSMEVGYLPTWGTDGHVQNDVRAVLGARM